jgi:hypothetical protein
VDLFRSGGQDEEAATVYGAHYKRCFRAFDGAAQQGVERLERKRKETAESSS